MLSIAFLVALAVVCAWLLSRLREPSSKGRRLSEWVKDISPTMLPRLAPRTASMRIQPQTTVVTFGEPVLPLPWGGVVSNTPNLVDLLSGTSVPNYPPQHDAAAAAIRQIGTNAIPHLLRAIYSRDGKLKKTCIEWSDKQNLVKLRLATAEEKQMYALPALRELGALALPAWVELATNHLASREVQIYAANRLFELVREGAITAPQLDMLMEKHPTPEVRSLVIAGMLMPLNLTVLPPPDRVARTVEMWSLGFMGDDPDTSIRTLGAALDDASPMVRQEALLAMGKFGADAIAATNAIQRMLDDPEPGVRSTATNVLKRVLQGEHSIHP